MYMKKQVEYTPSGSGSAEHLVFGNRVQDDDIVSSLQRYRENIWKRYIRKINGKL